MDGGGGEVMKIVATVTDVGAVIHAGGAAESRSCIIDIPNEALPELLKRYLANKKWASEQPNRCSYQDVTFSLLDE
jgi:hypothetical protein